MGDSTTNIDLRRKLRDDEGRKCPHEPCDKWAKNFRALSHHCRAIHHLEAKNYCQYCRAPFGSKKSRDIHETQDHPPTSGSQKKQTESVSKEIGKGTGKAQN